MNAFFVQLKEKKNEKLKINLILLTSSGDEREETECLTAKGSQPDNLRGASQPTNQSVVLVVEKKCFLMTTKSA